jgi:1,4-dihydroxy-6-naphthoate synthase
MAIPDPLTIAHSPDADDAFMFYALSTGKVPAPGGRVEHVLSDIETLNQAAMQGKYHVTAISAHQYPYLRDQYRLCVVGASVGDNYGPVVVSRTPLTIEDLKTVTVAIPGERTTAALSLRLCVPEVTTVVKPFDQILKAVDDGEAEAGVIIHEGQVTYTDAEVHKVVDLGEWWKEDTGGLPLPLGLNAIRRDLSDEDSEAICGAIQASIQYALDHRDEALEHALAYGRGTPKDKADTFVGMYVNNHTLDLGDDGRAGLDTLLSRARAAGLIPDPGSLDWVAARPPQEA